MYRDKGEYDTAIFDFNKAIELGPKLAKAYFNRAYAYNRKGDKAQARADLDKCIQISTDPGLTKAAKELRERL
jgi:tetratricopeptide (TPR) repeat protein